MNRFILALAISAIGAAYGQTAPAHPLAYVPIKTTDAKGINLHKYAGKEMVLFLFSTECEDCIKTVPVLNKIQQEHGSQKLQVVGIGINLKCSLSGGCMDAEVQAAIPDWIPGSGCDHQAGSVEA